MSRPKKIQEALRLMGNPYASLSLLDDEEDLKPEPTFEQKRAYLKKLENPHAFTSIFGESDDNLWTAAARRQRTEILKRELDEVLDLYKPYVARRDWFRLMDFKPEFLEMACKTPERAELVTKRLQKFRFLLSPGEKVEYNRAPAARIISELEKILSSDP